MFQVKTTLVLGAGASCAYDYPLGHGLIDKMVEVGAKWNRDANGNGNAALNGERLVKLLRFYDPVSIDSFLYSHDDRVLSTWAKYAIGEVLHSCADSQKFLRGVGTENWYRLLWNAIVSGKRATELLHHPLNLKIVTFNYDASLEAFLYSRVTAQDSIFKTDGEKDLFLAKLSECIHHVYGCVMSYQWCGGTDENYLYDIHKKGFNNPFIDKCKERIKLIGERDQDYSTPREWIHSAEQVLFLGFGFDDINIGEKVLNLKHSLSPKNRKGKGVHLQPMIKYTNFENSAIINRKVESLLGVFPDPLRLIKSTRTVYKALLEDFSLNSLH